MTRRRAVFLDRDGVLNRSPGPARFVTKWDEFAFLPGVPEALRRLRAAGFVLVAITSQSGVGRGLMTRADLEEIHARMQAALGDARLDAIYACVHHPDEGCPCRKPSPWLIRKAAEDLGLDLTRSYMVGDYVRDMVMGRRAGCRTVFCSAEPPPVAGEFPADARPDAMFASLGETADWILAQARTVE